MRQLNLDEETEEEWRKQDSHFQLSDSELETVWDKRKNKMVFPRSEEFYQLSSNSGFHKYSFVILDLLFRRIAEKAQIAKIIRELNWEINRRGLVNQAETIADYVIKKWLDEVAIETKDPNCLEIGQSILSVLSICPSPVDRTTLSFLVSNELPATVSACGSDDKVDGFNQGTFDTILTRLTDGLIVYEFFPRRRHLNVASLDDYRRYSVHSSVRQLIKIRIGHQIVPFADPGYFEFSAPESSGVGHPALGSKAVDYIYAHVSGLLRDARDPLKSDLRPGTKEAIHDRIKIETRLRCGLHLLRANLPLVQVLRLEGTQQNQVALGETEIRLDRHRDLIIRLLNGVRLYSGLPIREFVELTRKEVKSFNDFSGILDADELIWLYNELAMLCRWQGDLIYSRSILAQTEALRHEAQGNCGSEAELHLMIQRGAVELEMGYVVGAIGRLERARTIIASKETIIGDKESVLSVRALAYIAVADHVRGEFELAAQRYKAVLTYCREHDRLRSLSLFNRYLGNLRRNSGQPDLADRCYQDSLAAAAAHPDLFHFARIAQARTLITKPKYEPAQAARYLNEALNYAREAGLPRMEADVAAVRSDIRFYQGELDAAASAARVAIALSSRRGMRLRVVANLVRLGRIQSARGDKVNARIILEDAYRRARDMLYVTAAKDAHEALMEIEG